MGSTRWIEVHHPVREAAELRVLASAIDGGHDDEALLCALEGPAGTASSPEAVRLLLAVVLPLLLVIALAVAGVPAAWWPPLAIIVSLGVLVIGRRMLARRARRLGGVDGLRSIAISTRRIALGWTRSDVPGVQLDELPVGRLERVTIGAVRRGALTKLSFDFGLGQVFELSCTPSATLALRDALETLAVPVVSSSQVDAQAASAKRPARRLLVAAGLLVVTAFVVAVAAHLLQRTATSEPPIDVLSACAVEATTTGLARGLGVGNVSAGDATAHGDGWRVAGRLDSSTSSVAYLCEVRPTGQPGSPWEASVTIGG